MKLSFLSCCLLSALCLSTLPSCKPSDSKTATEQAKANPQLEARRQKQPLLALVPAETSLLFTLEQINPLYRKALATQTGSLLKQEIAQQAMKDLAADKQEGEGVCPLNKIKELADLLALNENISPLEDVIISVGDKQAEFIGRFSRFFNLISHIDTLEKASQEIIPDTLEGKENPAAKLALQLIEEQKKEALTQAKALFLPLKEAKSAPLMILGTLSQGKETSLPKKWQEALAKLKEKHHHCVKDYTLEKDGWSLTGLEISSELALKKYLALSESSKTSFPASLLTDISPPSLYLLTGVKDKQMVLFVCTNPLTQTLFATSPESSILASDKLAFLDSSLKKDLVSISYISPEFLQLNNTVNQNPIAPFVSFLEKLSPALTPNSDKIKELCETLLKSTQSLTQFAYGTYDLNVPATSVAWMDKGLKIESVCGKNQYFKESARFTQVTPAQFPDATLMGYSSSTKSYDKKVLLDMEESVASAYGLAQALSTQPQLKTSTGPLPAILEQIKTYQNDIKDLWSGIKKTEEALGNQGAFVLEMKQDLPPMFPSHVRFIGLPEISYACTVDKREELTKAWEFIEAGVIGACTKINLYLLYSGNRPITKEDIAPKKTTEGDWTIYSYPYFGTDNICPSLVLDSSLFTLGTSLSLNKKLATVLKNPAQPVQESAALYWASRTFFTQLAERVGKQPEPEAQKAVPYLKAMAADLKEVSYKVTEQNDKTVIYLSFDAE